LTVPGTARRRSAFISGGSSGIGLAVAEALLRAGYGVTISARQPEKLARAAQALSALGPVDSFAADFRDEDAIRAAIDRHAATYDGLDVLFNNAGVGVAESVRDVRAKAIDLLLAVNLRAQMLCTRMALPLLERTPGAYIFNVSSYTGVRPQPGLSAYSASKAGLIAYGDALRAEVGPLGIRVSTICPAFVDTAMASAVHGFVDRDRLIAPSDVAAVTMTLLGLSPACTIPLVVMEAADGTGELQGWPEASRAYRPAVA